MMGMPILCIYHSFNHPLWIIVKRFDDSMAVPRGESKYVEKCDNLLRTRHGHDTSLVIQAWIRSAGTVEFMVSGDKGDQKLYFLEMTHFINKRFALTGRVEHNL